MKRDRYNITIYKNESLALAVALKDKNGTAIDLTNATLTAQKNAIYDVKIAWTNGTVKRYLGGDVQIVDTVTA